MDQNLPLKDLRTQAAHLQNQLKHLAPTSPEYLLAKQQFHLNRQVIGEVNEQVRQLGNGLSL